MYVGVEAEVRGRINALIWLPQQILTNYRIRTLPHTRPRIVVPRPVVIQPRLFVQLLAGVEIRRPLGVGMLLHPRLAEREVLDVLVQFAVLVGDEAGAAQVVRVVVPDEFALAVDRGGGVGFGDALDALAA